MNKQHVMIGATKRPEQRRQKPRGHLPLMQLLEEIERGIEYFWDARGGRPRRFR